MSDLSDHDWSRLTAHLAGVETAETHLATAAWIEGDPALSALFARIRQTWIIAEGTSSAPLDREALKLAVAERISAIGMKSAQPTKLYVGERRNWRQTTGRAGMAVGACLLAIGVVTVWRGTYPTSAMTKISRTYATAPGEQATITFANGSHAVLGPATTLYINTRTTAGDAHSDVTLTGQALFTIVPRDRASFNVHTGKTVTRVLGTTFFVRRYGTDTETRVAVTEGRVSVANTRTARPPTVLAAHAVGVFSDSGQTRVAENAALDPYTSWTKGELIFHDTPITDVVAELSRVYAADVQVADVGLRKNKLTFNVTTSKALADVLDALAFTLDAHVVRRGKSFTLIPGIPSVPRRGIQNRSLHSETQYGR
jgi:ferric-dicitrate binding protein FerR (iron transport regulator)